MNPRLRTRIVTTITVVLGSWTWLCPGALASETLRVDGQAGNCSDTGGAPYCHIQAAIDRASPGATVEIAAGVYELWGESLSIDKSLTLKGAGADRTILDGNGRHPGPLISIAGTAADVGIRALTLTNRMRIVSPTAGAGGIDHFGQRLTIANTTIHGNLGGMGGALHAGTDFGSVILDNVTLSKNDALVGGAIDFRDAPDAQLQVTGSSILGNSAIFTGGGVFVRDVGTVAFTNVTLRGNESGNRGGGIYLVSQNEAGHMELRDSTVTGNRSKGAGGIDTNGDDIEIRLKDVVLAGNSSRNNPASSDCWAGSENTFISLGGNLVGNGDGCSFQPVEGDTVGTTTSPVKPNTQ
jgi:hypothetical protein